MIDAGANTMDITLLVNGNDYTGWYEQDFSRSMEHLSGKFSLSVMYDALQPYQLPKIQDGDSCQLYLGTHLLMTGFVDAANPFYKRNDIGMKIEGRDITCDLIDSSARYANGEWNNATFLRIAEDLCKSKGIQVVLAPGVGAGKPFTTFRIEAGETVSQTLSRAASYRGFMIYPTPEGKLLITKASATRAATMLKRGMNILSAERVGGMQNRFHTYRVQGQGDAVTFGADASALVGVAIDKQVRKTRELIICADSAIDSSAYQQRAEHTVRQRRGRAAYYVYGVEDWTHEDSTPWLINQRVDVDDPEMELNMVEFVTATVNYKCGRAEGKQCLLTLKPPVAFDELPVPEADTGWGT